MDSVPDVDGDFLTTDRDEVKNYLKNKYGRNYSCSVGTYGRLKLRQTFKDLAKLEGVSFNEANELTKTIDDQVEYEFFDLFHYALSNPKLYEFTQKHPEMMRKLRVLLNNPKSVSIHPSAVLVLPKEDYLGRPRELNNWVPVREIDGMNVCEWEGKYADAFGLLKNDILGLNTLDKQTYCLNLIKKQCGVEVDLDKIPLDDERVYELFSNGFNEDIFQFGGKGVKSFCKDFKPECVEDLNAITAAYRPGPISSGVPKLLADIKNGKQKVVYDFGMRKITEPTSGLWVYQEQIMQAFVVAGFSLVEADGVRTQMKKKDIKGMAKSKDKFIKGLSDKMKTECVYEGSEVEECGKIWDKLYGFSLYGFNRAHSFAYALISYQCQWLKANYPLQFWTTALNFGNEDVDIPYYLSEIKEIRKKIKGVVPITIASADINLSSERFECNPETNEILWSITKIKGIAETSSKKITDIRNEQPNGKFESLEQFLDVVPKKQANKKIVTSLIVAGAFDTVEGIKDKNERAKVLRKYYELAGHDASVCTYLNNPLSKKGYYWILKQKESTGHGDVDFESLLYNSDISRKIKEQFLPLDKFQRLRVNKKDFLSRNEHYTICGIVVDVNLFKGKKGEHCKILLDVNSTIIDVVIWNLNLDLFLDVLGDLKGKLVAMSGTIETDLGRGKNTMYLGEKSKIYEL